MATSCRGDTDAPQKGQVNVLWSFPRSMSETVGSNTATNWSMYETLIVSLDGDKMSQSGTLRLTLTDHSNVA